jgi:hypothetical protein
MKIIDTSKRSFRCDRTLIVNFVNFFPPVYEHVDKYSTKLRNFLTDFSHGILKGEKTLFYATLSKKFQNFLSYHRHYRTSTSLPSSRHVLQR